MKKTDWNIWIGIAGLFLSIIGSFSVLSFKMGVMNEKIMSIEDMLPRITNDIAGIKTDVAEIKVKLDVLWREHLAIPNSSSNKLNSNELNSLKASGVGNLIHRHYAEIFEEVKAMKPENPNEVQELLISVVSQFKNTVEANDLRASNLSKGYDMDSLLLIAAISIKDKVVEDLGLAP